MASPFEKVADFLPEALALVSPAGRLYEVNRAFAALLVRDKDDIVGKSLHELGLRHADGLSEYLRRCSGSRSFVLGAATHRRSDGSEQSYRCEGALFESGSEGREAMILLRVLPRDASSSRFVSLTQKIAELSAEISRRQRAEAEARQQRELLHVTLSSIGDAVIATDKSGHITFMNDVAERLTGWSRTDATGNDVRDIFRIIEETTRTTVEDPVSTVLSLGQVVGLANHTLLIARDGTERPIDDSGAPIVDPSGQLHGVVLVFRDVTGVRAVEKQEAAARRDAEAASRAKDEFLATLSHEMRTPLNAILGWARLLRRGLLEEARRSHAVNVIERNAETQARLVEDLLDMSRIAVGELRLEYAPLNLPQVIEAALDAVRPAAENKSLRISAEVRVSSAVLGDALRLQQVFWNLLANAVKFTPAGGTIAVRAEEEADAVRVEVSDSGEGIPAPFQSRMFDTFTQADASFSRPHGGLGLGLAIVRRLVEAHGGTVQAESQGLNRGATFTVRLPISGQVDTAPARAASARVRHLQGCRVLVVENDVDSSWLTTTLLEAAGADVVAVPRAREALKRIADGAFDVIVADIGLPDQDGFWLIEQVRRLPASPQRAPDAIALTAFGSIRDRQAALLAGYDEHIPKPVDLDQLLAAIGRLRARRAERPSGSAGYIRTE